MSENRSVEASGATIEEAIEAGLQELQVSRESVIVEILEEPSRGFLGISSRVAVVRLTTAARPRSELPVEEEDDFELVKPPERRVASDEELTDDIRIGRDKLQELLNLLDFEAKVVIEHSPVSDTPEEALILQVKGKDLRMLIGHKGETLAALQYITRLIASRDLERRADFVVDVAEYKTGRSGKLYMLAHRMADQAIARRRTVTMEPMPPHERRVIHMALREREDVTTKSIGEGRQRKVTIIPNPSRSRA